ncbi:TauD/TfdA family dioxygenase (plasmid) [Streptomyces sp. NBC_01724]|uniref:TauD/TfdA family dioxygenase n=1 Tax=Streptomyces sp. NBC_01724 TaxID=2975922 RepID=UPI002E3141E6|nr:TauD/TfdA family dioxygenase [Streptomyces sp. NBC_01724]
MYENSDTPDRPLPRIPFAGLPETDPQALVRQLRQALGTSPGAVVISDTPTGSNTTLLELAGCLGPVVTAGTTIGGNPLEPGGVYRVKPVNDGQGVEDENGLLIFSTTSQVFEGHTDGYHNPDPPPLVMLLCVRPDRGTYGRTLITDGAAVAGSLPTDVQALLRDPVFPTVFGHVPVLTAHPDRALPTVRFNMRELTRFRSAGHQVPADHWAAAEALHHLLCAPAHQWAEVLQAGDLLLLDNTRAVHAREALSPNSSRLLKRVWIGRTEGHQP